MKQAYYLDAKNDNTLWADATSKEMENVKVAFKILSDWKSAPIGHQFVQCHMVFDIKMEDFRWKAGLVAGGHMIEAPAAFTYASIVSRYTVRIALIIAALNDLEVKFADILNAIKNQTRRWGTVLLLFFELCG